MPLGGHPAAEFFLVYCVCGGEMAQKGFSPIIQLGNTFAACCIVCHIEFV